MINAAGVLTAPPDIYEAVHLTAPEALYTALPEGTRALLISAIGIDGATADFARYHLAAEALAKRTPLPLTAHRAYRIWYALGWPAFGALVAVFWLMMAKPTLW